MRTDNDARIMTDCCVTAHPYLHFLRFKGEVVNVKNAIHSTPRFTQELPGQVGIVPKVW